MLILRTDLDLDPPAPLPNGDTSLASVDGGLACFMSLVELTITTSRFLAHQHLLPTCTSSERAVLVAGIDAALNAFIEHLPQTLKWNPVEADDVAMARSSLVLNAYYVLQVQLHAIMADLEGGDASIHHAISATCVPFVSLEPGARADIAQSFDLACSSSRYGSSTSCAGVNGRLCASLGSARWLNSTLEERWPSLHICGC